MNELERKILKMLSDKTVVSPCDIEAILLFISTCSLSEFEKLKELEYDINSEDVQRP